jgi:hypothetical protein
VRRFLIVFPAIIGAIVLGALAVPMGEFVELYTVDADGHGYKSELWVVETGGALHLRSGWPDSHWLERIRTHPLVEIERGGERRHYRAVPVDDPAVRAAVNEAIAAKYGVADRLIRSVVDMEASVPVRLEPIEGLDEHHPH